MKARMIMLPLSWLHNWLSWILIRVAIKWRAYLLNDISVQIMHSDRILTNLCWLKCSTIQEQTESKINLKFNKSIPYTYESPHVCVLPIQVSLYTDVYGTSPYVYGPNYVYGMEHIQYCTYISVLMHIPHLRNFVMCLHSFGGFAH